MPGCVFELTQDRVNIGRDDDNLICLDHTTVSLHHAILVRVGTRYKVRDLISTNGTYVNGERVTGAELQNGDVVRFGEVEVRYEEPPQPAAQTRTLPSQTVLPLGRARPIAAPVQEAHYKIIGADGRAYGPVDAGQLKKWISQGYANAQTWVPAEARRNWKQLTEFPEFAHDLAEHITPTNLLGTPPKGARCEGAVKVGPSALTAIPEFPVEAGEAPIALGQTPRHRRTWPARVGAVLLLTLACAAALWWFDQWPFGPRGPFRKYSRGGEGEVTADPEYTMALLAEDARKYTELLKSAKVLASRYPDSALVHYILGNAYAKLGFFPDAATAFQEAIKLKPDYLDAWYNLGGADMRTGKLPEAANVFQQLAKLSPHDPQVWNNLGGVYAAQGHLADAVGAYHQAVQLKPDDADAQFRLGAAYASQGQNPEAVNAFRLALKQNPKLPDAWFNLGVISELQGEHNEATLFFQQALELKPNYVEAWGGLVKAYLNLHQPDKASEAAREMKKLDPVKANQLAEELSREAPQPISVPVGSK